MLGQSRKSLNHKKIICAKCKLEVSEKEDTIDCDVCKKTLHALCTKLDKREYENLLENTSIEFKCQFCDGGGESTCVSSDLLEIKTKLKSLDQLSELKHIKETMDFMSKQYDAILNGVKENAKKINNLQKENIALREEVRCLKSSVKFLNDDRVKNDCLINGVLVGENKTAVDVVLDIAGKVGAAITVQNIDDAYFMQNRKQTEKKSVVVKFTNKTYKNSFMAEKRKLKQIDSLKSVYVNDYLCRETMQLLNYAKTVKNVGYKFVFARGSNVFVRKNEKSPMICVKSLNHVDKILLDASKRVTSRLNEDAEVSEDDFEEETNNAFMSPN